MIAALILAAGKSQRMGHPKALLKYRGKNFLDLILESLAASPIDEVVVVLGHEAERILDQTKIPKWTYNADYEQGMTTSFQAGLRVLPEGVRATMLLLVDHPLVSADTIRKLVAYASEEVIVVPVFEGRRGHPVLFGREALDEILRLPPDRGADHVVRSRPERIIEVAVKDSGILVDIDTPQEFRTLNEKP